MAKPSISPRAFYTLAPLIWDEGEVIYSTHIKGHFALARGLIPTGADSTTTPPPPPPPPKKRRLVHGGREAKFNIPLAPPPPTTPLLLFFGGYPPSPPSCPHPHPFFSFSTPSPPSPSFLLLPIKASQCYFLNISQLGIIFHSIFNRGEPARYCMHAREWRV